MRLLSKSIKKFIYMIIAAAMVIGLLPMSAQARNPVDLNKDVSLTINYKDGDTAIEGASFSLYRVADMDESANFTVNDDFANSGVSLSTVYTKSSSVWAERASALQAYVAQRSAAKNAIKPAATLSTDKDGIVKFTKENASLSAGLYLLLGEQVKIGNTTYTPQASLLTLPYNETDDSWSYDAAITPKHDKKTDEPETEDLHVVVVWEDNDDALGLRPSKVKIRLLRKAGSSLSRDVDSSYETYDTVEVGVDENWRYTWTNLSTDDQWQVAELELPEDYTIKSIVREGNTFIVTNVIDTEPSPGSNPGGTGGSGTGTPSSNPGGTGGSGTGTGTGTGSQTKLPQTGQLWWPVSILGISGMFLVLLGVGLRRREARNHE